MNSKNKTNRLFVLWIILVLATYIALAKVFYVSLFSSAFKYYSFINGLDMQTLLNWGINVMHGNESANNFYVYIISILSRITNGSLYSINYIIIFQLLLGLFIVAVTIGIAYLCSNSKYCSIVAGFLTAFYSPLLMYEGFVLKTSLCVFLFVLTTLLALLVIKSKKIIYGLLLGITIGVFLNTFFGSLSIALMLILLISYYIYRGSLTKKIIFYYFVGVLISFISFYIVNKSSMPLSYSLNNSRWFEYIYSVGNQDNIETLNAPPYQEENKHILPTIPKPIAYMRKIAILFSFNEVPDNINYYFVRDGISPLKYIITPFILYILAFPSFLLCLLFMDKKFLSLICLCFIFMSIPLVIFIPLSRYTVMFAPLGCVIIAYGIRTLIAEAKKCNIMLAFTFLIVFLISLFLEKYYSASSFYRATDFTTYASALSIQNPSDERIIYAYKTAYLLAPNDRKTATIYSQMLMGEGNYSKALKVLTSLELQYQNNDNIKLLLTSALLGNNKILEAKKIIERINSAHIQDKNLYFYNLGTIYFINKEYSRSLSAYEKIDFNTTSEQLKKDVFSKITYIKKVLNIPGYF